jgi:hypothetical protein
MKYTIEVTETVNHSYEVEAGSEEEALEIYYSYDDDQLKALDLDGQSTWDTSPWDISTEESE